MIDITEVKAALQRSADAYTTIANERFGISLPIPANCKFDLKTKSVMAQASSLDMSINYNMRFAVDDTIDALNDTTPHEMSHLVQFALFLQKGVSTPPHGAEFCEIMRIFGVNPKPGKLIDHG
jgi:predicted SprT family Zn-dependent metalloprotease